jgi:hypothetical protein
MKTTIDGEPITGWSVVICADRASIVPIRGARSDKHTLTIKAGECFETHILPPMEKHLTALTG